MDQEQTNTSGNDVVMGSPVTNNTAKSAVKVKHPPPSLEQPASKRAKTSGDGMGFGFNNEAFSDHKLRITVKDSSEEATIVHVSKLLVAGKSVWFRTHITPETTAVELPAGSKVAYFVDIVKWMYEDKFETSGLDLLDVMTLAFEFQVANAIDKCATELLSNHMNVVNSCRFIENEMKMRKDNPDSEESDFAGFLALWNEARAHLKEQYKDFTMERWSTSDFHNLSVDGLKVIFSSDDLKMGIENTVFAAFREWIHHDFEKRKHDAAQLIPFIRFPLLHQNYLLDVVRTEADLDYPDEAKKQFAKKIIDAYVFHCNSPDRRDALKEGKDADSTPRAYTNELLKTKFDWKIDNISSKKEAHSESFFIGGYYLYLLFQRKNPTAKGGGTVALYMHLRIKESGLGSTFYLPLAFELLSRNKATKKYVSSKGVYASPFTFQNRAWGYIDILGMSWDEFVNNSVYIENDCLHVRACVAFREISNPSGPQ